MAQAEALAAAPIPHIDVLVSEFGPPGTPWNAKDYFPGGRGLLCRAVPCRAVLYFVGLRLGLA